MKVISSISELRQHLAQQSKIVFVPTMGNLHQGHLNLVRQARQQGDDACVVVSIFVNPLQFGPSEDFDRYPRTLEADCALLQDCADIVFAPAVNDMYPEQQTLFVEPPPIANQLCGAARPGHFRGMATVVLKLFNIVQPHIAIFGKKDYQQLHIIRQMVKQLNLAIQIIGGETVRAPDGLALSSRNQYLSSSERAQSILMSAVLQATKQAILQGRRDYHALQQQATQQLSEQGWQVDYVAIRNQSNLLDANERELVILAAAKLGNTRLLDNVELSLLE